jgi:FkbM family methyltransferase
MPHLHKVLSHGAGIASAVWQHPANRQRRIAAVLDFFGWQISKRVLRRPRVIGFHGKKLKCYPNSTSTSAALYFNGLADYWEMKFVLAYLRPGDHFLDVGANAGVYSILAASRIGEGGSIDAFEPLERMALRIEEQAALNALRNVTVHRLAVGERNGVVEFGFAASDAMMHIRHATEKARNASWVDVICLDDFGGDKEYAMGKMDIEGAESLALKGCVQRLHRSNPPVWLLEMAGYSNYYGMTTADLVALLDRDGYDCAVYDPKNAQLIYTNRPWERGVQNVLAIARARRQFVEERIAVTR